MKKFHKIEKADRCPDCGALESLKVTCTIKRGMKRANGLPFLNDGEVRRQYKRCTLCGARVTVSIKE